VIGIVDGYFEHRPAVWHKEILAALDSGVHVVGASSMGALRAAELEAFGMEGVGTVFELYRDGVLIADEEVAVAHTSAADGYRQTSEALVNIRATLDAAHGHGVVSAETRTKLIDTARGVFYPERSWPLLLQLTRETGIEPTEIDALEEWVRNHRVDRKAEDAVALLDRVADLAADPFRPKQVSFHLERTSNWLRVAQGVDGGSPPELAGRESLILDELRLDPAAYATAREKALTRWLAAQLADGHDLQPSDDAMRDHVERFRRVRGLISEEALSAWMSAGDLDAFSAESLWYSEVRSNWILAVAETWLHPSLIDVLRADGSYEQLAARAGDKQRALEEVGLDRPSAGILSTDEQTALDWFWRSHGLPEEAAAPHLVDDLGFANEVIGLTAVLRELAYRRLSGTLDPPLESAP
jgi:hypothetical protein